MKKNIFLALLFIGLSFSTAGIAQDLGRAYIEKFMEEHSVEFKYKYSNGVYLPIACINHNNDPTFRACYSVGEDTAYELMREAESTPQK